MKEGNEDDADKGLSTQSKKKKIHCFHVKPLLS